MSDTGEAAYADAVPDGAGPATSRRRRPPTAIRVAVLLMLADVLLYVASGLSLPSTEGRLRDSLHAARPSLSAEAVVQQVDRSVQQTLVLSAVFSVLLVLLATQVWRGRNWARVGTLIYAALGVLTLVQTLVHATSSVWLVAGWVALLVNVALVVLLVGRTGRAYFASKRRRPTAPRPA
jgi:hypothetical protein